MEMLLYDTAAGRVLPWTPPKTVKMYVCGITPYDAAHMGHIFTFLTYDLLQRYLEDQGHEVIMVRNITDVDEPIFKRAASLRVPYMQLAERETSSFHEVLSALNFRPLNYEPKASQYIDQMAAAVSLLVRAGIAYSVDDDIYFDVTKDPRFGSFSQFNDKLRRGLFAARGGDPMRAGKRSPYDFLLWRAISDPLDSAAWTTPSAPVIPRGRPGWHIECSVMSSELLGAPFDLHGGGNDLLFPHHECEIAQTRALAAQPNAGPEILASRWMHVAPLHCSGEKMSKSLGNLVFAKDLLKIHEPSVIRLALMNYHFRIGGEWLDYWLRSATEMLSGIRENIRSNNISRSEAERFGTDIRAALANCLDTHSIVHSVDILSKPRAARPAALADIDKLRKDFELLGLVL